MRRRWEVRRSYTAYKWGLVTGRGVLVCTICFRKGLGYWCYQGCAGRFCPRCLEARRETRGCLRCNAEEEEGP